MTSKTLASVGAGKRDRGCPFACVDPDGTRHSVDVRAESSYDAAHLYLNQCHGAPFPRAFSYRDEYKAKAMAPRFCKRMWHRLLDERPRSETNECCVTMEVIVGVVTRFSVFAPSLRRASVASVEASPRCLPARSAARNCSREKPSSVADSRNTRGTIDGIAVSEVLEPSCPLTHGRPPSNASRSLRNVPQPQFGQICVAG
jgi:hypothetical protein